jgi:hypothetical protein
MGGSPGRRLFACRGRRCCAAAGERAQPAVRRRRTGPPQADACRRRRQGADTNGCFRLRIASGGGRTLCQPGGSLICSNSATLVEQTCGSFGSNLTQLSHEWDPVENICSDHLDLDEDAGERMQARGGPDPDEDADGSIQTRGCRRACRGAWMQTSPHAGEDADERIQGSGCRRAYTRMHVYTRRVGPLCGPTPRHAPLCGAGGQGRAGAAPLRGRGSARLRRGRSGAGGPLPHFPNRLRRYVKLSDCEGLHNHRSQPEVDCEALHNRSLASYAVKNYVKLSVLSVLDEF